jgi:VWFA-related protein
MPFFHTIVGLALSAWMAPSQAPAPDARAELWIDAVVVDRRDAPVTDLKPSEFEVWISGYRIPITDVVAVSASDGVPRDVVVILDDAAVPPALEPRVREAAMAMVERMAPGDRMSILSLNRGKVENSDDKATLRRAIDAYHVIGFPFRIEDAGEHVLRTLTSVSRQVTEASAHRKAVVAIGAPWMFDTPLPPPALADLNAQWVEAMRAMAAAHITLYVIDPGGISTAPGPTFGGSSGFARETGGYAFVNTNSFPDAAERVWQELRTYYRLGITNPPIRRTADLREVEVKVLRKGVNVRARRAIPGR